MRFMRAAEEDVATGGLLSGLAAALIRNEL